MPRTPVTSPPRRAACWSIVIFPSGIDFASSVFTPLKNECTAKCPPLIPWSRFEKTEKSPMCSAIGSSKCGRSNPAPACFGKNASGYIPNEFPTHTIFIRSPAAFFTVIAPSTWSRDAICGSAGQDFVDGGCGS